MLQGRYFAWVGVGLVAQLLVGCGGELTPSIEHYISA